jgi:tetratricopeptide (TPR) repeat protein
VDQADRTDQSRGAESSALVADVRRRLRERYDQVSFGDDEAALADGLVEVDALEAGLHLARGRLLHAQTMRDRLDRGAELAAFEQAVSGFAQLGDVGGEAEATFWVGTYHQVVRADYATAEPALRRAHELAVLAGDRLILSYVERHLGFIEQRAGRLDEAEHHFEASLALRRELDLTPGVAAALLALAELHAERGNRELASSYLTQARAVAEASEARGVLRWIAQAEQDLAAT